jgi:hypothetical protein
MAANPLLITDSDISGALKNTYESYRINAFPVATPLMAQLKRAKRGGVENMRWGGNGVYWDVVLTRPVGMSASQTGQFPPTATELERQANVGIKRTYVRRQIDMLTIVGTTSKKAAFIPMGRKIIRSALDAARLGQNEVLHGDGRAFKALITTATDTTHVIVQHPYGLDSAGKGGLLLDKNMYIAVLDATDSWAVLGRATISNVANSGDSATLTLDTAISSMAAGDAIVAATEADTSYNNYPNGLLNLLNRGGSYDDLHGINAATAGQARWNTSRLVAGTDTADAAQPSEMDVWELAQIVAGKSGKDAKTNPGQFLLQTTPGVQKKLAESFLGQRKLTPQDFRPIRGGFKAIDVFGLPLLADFWNPAGTIYMIHLPSIAWVDRQDWVKLAYEGAGPFRWIDGRDAYEVTFGSYWNTAVLNRITHGMITGYVDTVRYDHTV